MPKRSTIFAGAVTAATALAVSVLAAPPSAQAAPARKSVAHTKPMWVSHARHLGNASGHARVNARVYLQPRGGLAAVRQAAIAMSTPGNASYHHFLTPAQYRARFGTTNATVSHVQAWLRSTGLHVSKAHDHNGYVVVRGTVAQAEQAFGTQIERYRHDGRIVRAPASNVRVPATVAGSVLAVSGLDTSPHRVAPTSTHQAPPPAGFRNAAPCSIYWGQIKAKYQADYRTPLPTFDGQTLPYAPCGYTGPQFRAAYEGANRKNLDGAGVTVAITDAYAAPTIAKDANKYASQHGDGSYARGQLTQRTAGHFRKQGACGPSGWYGEETLDVEAVHAMAPSANIVYYGAASCYDNDLLDALQQVVDDNTAQLVSNSWGEVEEAESVAAVRAYEKVFLQGATQGISFMFSSGDNGDEVASTGIKQADYPTSDPFVTSVGGTSTGIGAAGHLRFQTGWGTVKYSLSQKGTSWVNKGYLYGAGGGTSSLFNRPAYQHGVTRSPRRQVPDVAMDADPNTGMLVGETQTFPHGTYYDEYRIGGTSLASPLFAGMTALSIEAAGSSFGLLNPTIYNNRSAFTDVRGQGSPPGDVRVDYVNGVDASDGLVYSVRTFDQDSSLKCVRGYDLVTGVGVPNPGWLTVAAAG